MVDDRLTCALCALKHVAQARALTHIAQARILGLETKKGYTEHYWFAMGHLAEAEDELGVEYPELAKMVRDERKHWESDPFYVIPFAKLVVDIAKDSGYDIDLLLESEGKEALWQV